jgi:PD-(D/E)XK nuclease superfamily
MLDPLSISIPIGAESFTPTDSAPSPQRKLLQPSPDALDDYILELDYSTISSFMQCPRMFENYAVRGRELSGPSSATDFGRLFHECEEIRLREGWNEVTKAKQFQKVSDHFLSHPVSPSDHRTSERMLAVLHQYNKTYNESIPDDWPKKVMHVEVPFKVPLCSVEVRGTLPYSKSSLVVGFDEDERFAAQLLRLPISSLHILYIGRIDCVLRDSNLLWVADHKTASRGGKEFVEAFRLSRQTMGYVWAAQKLLGEEFAGCILNALVIKPPTLKLFNNTDLERHTFFYSQDHLAEWEEGMKATVSDIVACLLRGQFPQQGALSFKSWCPHCDYAENCTLPPAQRAADLASNLYQNVTWSPLE